MPNPMIDEYYDAPYVVQSVPDNGGNNDVWGTLIKGGIEAVRDVNLAKVQRQREAQAQGTQIAFARLNPWGAFAPVTMSSPNGTGTAAFNPAPGNWSAYPQADGKIFDAQTIGSYLGFGLIAAAILALVALMFGRR